MYQFFLICATIGGTILVLKLALSLLGFGFEHADGHPGAFADSHVELDHAVGHAADHDGEAHHDQSQLGRIFTFQAIVTFLAFFGVGGLATLEARHGGPLAVLIGTATGVVAVFVLGYVVRGLRTLQKDGTVRIESAVGLPGQVYLRIPAHGLGEGKITLPIQGRTIEILARTPGPELRTGEPVVVSKVIDDRTIEVVAPQSLVVKSAPLAE